MLNRLSIILVGWFFLAGWTVGHARGAASIGPDDLRCESLIDPQGIDVIHPRLNWALSATSAAGRGLTQSAYQIQVASSPQQLAEGHGDLWDSGKVSSAESINIRYAGIPLQSLEPCFWRVMVWDGTGQHSTWSKPASWSMGLLHQDDWKGQWIGQKQKGDTGKLDAKWIWYPEGNPAASAPVGTRFFRRVLTIPADRPVESAVLKFTADNEATITINGQRMGFEDNFHELKKVDLTASLHAGDNILAAVLRNTGDAPNPAGFIAQLEIQFVTGDPVVLVTDANWKAAKLESPGWEKTEFNDSSWAAARELGNVGMSPWGDPTAGSQTAPARQLRKEFVTEKAVRRATVCYSGLGWSELYINGNKVGNEVLSPPLSDYSKRTFYVTHDVTSLVKPGDNAMGVWLGNGRYFAPRLTVPAPTKTYGLPTLRLQLHLEYTDGTAAEVVSDGTWKSSTDGAITANNEYDGEDYDARKEWNGWTQPNFDDSKWTSADEMTPPPGQLVATMIDPSRVTGTLKPVSVKRIKPGVFIFDMGQNFAGWCQLRVNGPRGTVVTLRHGERLNTDGTLYTENLRSAKATDSYILKGNGTELYEPRFTLHGFQYVEVTGYPGTPTLSSIEGHVVGDDLESAGEFNCSNQLINQIYHNIVWGTRSSYRSIVTDCCQRDERQGWLGDRNEESRGESYVYRNGLLYAKWVQDMADSQRADGVVSDVCPAYWEFYGNSVTWPSSMIIIPGMLIDQNADMSAVERNYPNMVRWMHQMAGNIAGDILPRDAYGDWCSPPDNLHTPYGAFHSKPTSGPLIATTYFYDCSKLMSRYAKILNKPDDEARFDVLAARMQKGLNDTFYKKDRGCYDNGSAASNVLPLAFGMVPPDQQQRVVDQLADTIIHKNHGHISTGLIGCQWINSTLANHGRADLALMMATQTTYPSLGYMIENHATTIWELWNGNTAGPGMNSGNHMMLIGDLCKFFYEDLAGIRPDPLQPGFAHVIMYPNPVGDLTSATGTHRSAHGVISSSWNKKGKEFRWEINIPPNTTATLFVPATSAKDVIESGKPAAEAKGLKFIEMHGDRAEFTAGSGGYLLQSR